MPLLLTSPIIYLAATLLAWVVCYFLLTRVFDLSPRQWKGLEFLWIFIGLLGVTSLLEQNKRDISEFKQDNLKRHIINGVEQVRSDLRIYFGCVDYIKTEYSPEDFDDRQYDQALLCKWASAYKLKIDSVTGLPSKNLSIIDSLKLKLRTDQHVEVITAFNKNVLEINQNLNHYHKLTNLVKDHFWQDFQRSIGLLLILLAFAIRLTIAAKNYFDAKPSEKLKQTMPPVEDDNDNDETLPSA